MEVVLTANSVADDTKELSNHILDKEYGIISCSLAPVNNFFPTCSFKFEEINNLNVSAFFNNTPLKRDSE